MKLSASCLFAAATLVSGIAFAQPAPYSAQERIHWIDGQTVTITYSPAGAPAQVSSAAAAKVLADIEAKFDSLGIAGLDVAIGNREVANGCAGVGRNTVHICWEPRTGTTADARNTGNTDGSVFWREGTIILSSSTTWTEASVYATLMHYMLHVLGFGHPVGDSVQNGAADLTALDISGLQTMYGAGSCALTYDATLRQVEIPFVKYRGGTYTARLQHNGGNDFTIVPGSIGMLNSANMPTSRCHGLAIDANNDLYIPQVNVGNSLFWANLRFENGRLTLTGRGQ
ncbi:MAG TPA: hypothetical protein VGE69_04510 [Pseudomonadales bacterium]